MKIRNGFVSNSSSSSFCVFGVSTENINTDALEQKQISKVSGCHHIFDREKNKFCVECGSPSYKIVNNWDGLHSYICDMANKHKELEGFTYRTDDEHGSYIGFYPRHMKEDETLAQFRTRFDNAYELLFGEKPSEKATFISGANYG